MTTTDRITINEVNAPARPGKLLALTAVTFAAGVPFTLWGAHDRIEIAIVLGIMIVTTTLVYGVLLPQELRRPDARVAMILSAVAGAILLPAHWSTMSLLLGVPGAILGYAAWKADQRPRTAIAAMVIGALATLGYFVVYIDEVIRLGLN
jgi:hypothetical protein